MPDLANLVRVSSATVGTGTVTLGSAVSGFLTPTQAGMVDGAVYSYAIEADYTTVGSDTVPTSREVGHGVYSSSGGTLTRSVVNSTNSNALLNLAGDAQVIIAVTTESFGLTDSLTINGGMQVSQEKGSTAQTGITSFAYIVDMFGFSETAAATVTVQQVTDSPNGFSNSLKVSVTAADASIAAGDVASVYTWVLGYDAAQLEWGTASAQSVSLGFWIKAHRTGQYAVAIENSSGNRSYPISFNVNAADTWEYKQFTIPGDTSGTWNTTTGAGIYIYWTLAAGSTFQGTNQSWQAGDIRSVSGQVNGIGATSDTFQITGVTLLPGTVPVSQGISAAFIREFNDQLIRCMTFYEKSFDYVTAPAQNVGINNGETIISQAVAGAVGQSSPTIMFKKRKRSDPTMTFYNPAAANAQMRNITRTADDTSTTLTQAYETGFHFSFTGTSGSAAGDINGLHWVADSRL